MFVPDQPPDPSEQPLPLFRPEAVAAQQQKVHGEILRIRPLSFGLLLWVGLALAGLVLAVLLLGPHIGSSPSRSSQTSAVENPKGK